jgi:hypothetical protein
MMFVIETILSMLILSASLLQVRPISRNRLIRVMRVVYRDMLLGGNHVNWISADSIQQSLNASSFCRLATSFDKGRA